jgi:hypothetical protein
MHSKQQTTPLYFNPCREHVYFYLDRPAEYLPIPTDHAVKELAAENKMTAVKFVHANQNNLGFVKTLEYVNALLHGTRSTKKWLTEPPPAPQRTTTETPALRALLRRLANCPVPSESTE